MIKIIITWHNAGPHTIWAKLAEKLGREPTSREAADDVRRILREAREDYLDKRGITQERRAGSAKKSAAPTTPIPVNDGSAVS